MMHGVPQSETQEEPDRYPPLLRFHRFPLEMPYSERRLLLLVGDTLTLFGCAFLAQYWQRLLEPHMRHSDYQIWWLAILGVAWLLGAAINECYTLQRSQRRFNALRQVCVATIEAGLIYLVVFFLIGRPAILPVPSATTYPLFLKLNPPPRLLPVFFLLATLLLMTGWRLAYLDLLHSRLWRRRVLIVGAGRAGCALVEAIQRTRHDYEIVGFIDDDPAKQATRLQGVPVLGTHHELLQLVQTYQVSEVVLAITNDIDMGVWRVLMHCYEQCGLIIIPNTS
jgi:FlaA1/EpsC-like NDP-sugar epimerase